MIRHIHNKGVPNAVSERLELVDESSQTLVLSIVGNRPPGITAYVAEGHVVEIDAARCRLDYRALITTASGREERVRDAVLKTWAVMFQGLEAAVR
jgi:hypothetical protein